MTLIATLLFFAGVMALLAFFPCWWNDRNSSAAGVCLAIAFPCLIIGWAMFGFPT